MKNNRNKSVFAAHATKLQVDAASEGVQKPKIGLAAVAEALRQSGVDADASASDFQAPHPIMNTASGSGSPAPSVSIIKGRSASNPSKGKAIAEYQGSLIFILTWHFLKRTLSLSAPENDDQDPSIQEISDDNDDDNDSDNADTADLMTKDMMDKRSVNLAMFEALLKTHHVNVGMLKLTR